MLLLPSAHMAAMSMAMPARTSGETSSEPPRRDGPGHHGAVRVAEDDPRPHADELVHVEHPRLEHLLVDEHRALRLRGHHRAMLMRSAGKPGQGASSILGIWPPMVGTTFRLWAAGTRMVSPEVSQVMPSLREGELHHAQVLRGRVLDLDLPAGDRGQADEGADLHVVAADAEVVPDEPRHALDGEDVGADARDARPHGDEHAAEVLHVRLGGGVLDDGRALRQDGRHERVLRGGDRGLVQEERRALSLLAESVKKVPVSTRAPSSTRARKCVSSGRRPMTSPPGGGRSTPPLARQQGPGEEDGGADLLREVRGDLLPLDVQGLEAVLVVAELLHASCRAP